MIFMVKFGFLFLKKLWLCDIIILLCSFLVVGISLIMILLSYNFHDCLFLLFIGLLLTILMLKELLLIKVFSKWVKE